MANWKNTEIRYGIVAMTLHWLIASGIIFLVCLGVYMTSLPKGSSIQLHYFQLHKSIGITILFLSVLRLVWRLLNPVPPLPDGMRPWERFGARAIHYAFYFLIIAIPLSGWAFVSTSPLHIKNYYFGLVPLPKIPVLAGIHNKKAVTDALVAAHKILGWSAVALLVLHITAALKHHFVLKDSVLRRMLP